MNRIEAKRAIMVVSGPAHVSVITREGEVLLTEQLTPGRHKGKDYIKFMPSGSHLALDGDVTPLLAPSRLYPVPYGAGAFESGANPDFKVTSATRQAREMAILMDRLTAKDTVLDRKLAALNGAAKRKGKGLEVAKEEDVDLIDDDDDAAKDQQNADNKPDASETKPDKPVKAGKGKDE